METCHSKRTPGKSLPQATDHFCGIGRRLIRDSFMKYQSRLSNEEGFFYLLLFTACLFLGHNELKIIGLG